MKLLKYFFHGILGYILKIVLAVVVAISSLIAYFSLQMLLFGRGDYLLFVSNEYNIVPAIMIMILIIYWLMVLGDKFINYRDEQIKEDHCEFPLELDNEEDYIVKDNMYHFEEEPMDYEKLCRYDKIILKLLDRIVTLDNEKINTKLLKALKVIRIAYIPILLIAMYLGTTSYAILYNNSVKLSSPMNPSGVIYSYSDIKTVEVAVKKGLKKDYTPYYKLTFKDGKTVDFFGGGAQEDHGLGFENILNDLDKKLLAQGVSKSVNKDNFEKYSKGLDKDFIRKVEKLFDNK